MSTATTTPSPSATAAPTTWTSPRPYRLSVAQYEQMIRHGVLTKRDKVELIEGLLVEKMTRNSLHLTTTWRFDRAFATILPIGWLAVTGWPVVLARSEPEPGVMILRGSIDDYWDRKPVPADVSLLVEVADSSPVEDRAWCGLFAEAGLLVYWIANIPERRIEVYSEPVGGGYRARRDYGHGEVVPLVVEGRVIAELAVGDLMPSRDDG